MHKFLITSLLLEPLRLTHVLWVNSNLIHVRKSLSKQRDSNPCSSSLKHWSKTVVQPRTFKYLEGTYAVKVAWRATPFSKFVLTCWHHHVLIVKLQIQFMQDLCLPCGILTTDLTIVGWVTKAHHNHYHNNMNWYNQSLFRDDVVPTYLLAFSSIRHFSDLENGFITFSS